MQFCVIWAMYSTAVMQVYNPSLVWKSTQIHTPALVTGLLYLIISGENAMPGSRARQHRHKQQKNTSACARGYCIIGGVSLYVSRHDMNKICSSGCCIGGVDKKAKGSKFKMLFSRGRRFHRRAPEDYPSCCLTLLLGSKQNYVVAFLMRVGRKHTGLNYQHSSFDLEASIG